jgi:predicted Ser/Thr protein kinase
MNCTVCKSQNEDTAETCFTCGQPLVAVVTRGTLIAQRYEILSPLGRGGMGVVYKAHDRVLDETVALKILRGDIAQDPDMARRFRTEIRLARRVRHKNVCGIHEYGEDGRIHFIAMEFIEGIDLKKILKQSRVGLRSDEAFEVAIQVAEGLQAIHDAGIIHRDLKTPNIMRDAKGHVRLMDFGIAKEEGAASGQTATGLIVGTPEYMSPEQARGEKVDSRTDIYALGIVIFEVFTGEVPFRGETPLATIMKHLKDPPPVEVMDAHQLPPEVRGVLLKALAKEQNDRFATASHVAEALRQARLRQSEPLSAPAPPVGAGAWSVADGSAQTTAMPTPTPRPARVTPPPPRADRAAAIAPRAARAPIARAVGVTAAGRYRTRRTPAWLFALPVIALAVVVGGALAMWSSAPSPPAQAPAGSREGAAGSMTLGTPAPATAASATPDAPPEPARPTVGLPSATPALASRPTPAPTPFRTPATPAPAVVPTTLATLPFKPATPTPAPAPARGDLWIVVSPWANVSVDGQDLGTSPVRTPLDAGKHDVMLSHPQYQPVRRKVTVTPGKVLRLDVDLAQDAVPK